MCSFCKRLNIYILLTFQPGKNNSISHLCLDSISKLWWGYFIQLLSIDDDFILSIVFGILSCHNLFPLELNYLRIRFKHKQVFHKYYTLDS